MCSVIGFHSRDAATLEQKEALVRIFQQSKIRGLHAFGISYRFARGDTKILRTSDIGEIYSTILNSDFCDLIGHCRYSTSGDWRDMLNNQPIVDGDVHMVFNGVISQATKEENEAKYGFAFATDNDGEILTKKIRAGENWEQWISSSNFSFAGLVLLDEIVAIRNKNRPLWFSSKGSCVYVASTRDILLRAKVGSTIQPFEENQAFDLRNLL